MIDHPGPLHHIIQGPVHPPAPGTPGPPAPGTAHPPGPVPGPPVGERSPAGEGVAAVVHNPPNPRPERERPPVHNPPNPHRERELPPDYSLSGPRHERVVLVHGFTQTLASWEAVGERLAGRFEVVRVDLPGHGGSGGVRVGF